MAVTLRLNDEQTRALRELATREGRSVEDIAVAAVLAYVADRTRRGRVIDQILTDHADVLNQLGSV